MPISTTCPDCRTTYRVADQLEGKKIRCKKCQAVIAIPPAPAATVALEPDETPIQARPVAPTSSPQLPRRPRLAEVDDDDDAAESAIRRRQKEVGKRKTSKGLWATIGGVVGAIAIAVGVTLALVNKKPEPNRFTPQPIVIGPNDVVSLVDLKPFSPDGTFSVLLPATAKVKVEKVEGETVNWWGLEGGGRSIGVTFFPLEAGFDGANPKELEALLDAVQGGVLDSFKGTASKVQKITLAGGYSGRSVEAVCAPGGDIVKLRLYVVSDRVIQFIAGGPKPWIDSPEIEKCLSSLQLTPGDKAEAKTASLAEARQGFKSKLRPVAADKTPPAQPPPALFRTVRYDAPGGKFAAYFTPDPKDGKKHPAIVWITGGDCNSIDEGCWNEGPPANEQSASAYRKAGIVMLFPSLRGGNNNPGVKEGFLGEVDDVLAAADFLARQPYVDPERIYLGGHSTGGTLALLTAECSSRFRAVFSFGPAHDVSGYGPEFMPFDATNPREVELRSPGLWLASIKTPTFVIEGSVQGNLGSLQTMSRTSKNPNVHFLPIRGATHFSTLAPTNRLLADKILRDTGPVSNVTITEEEILKRPGK